MSKPCDYDAYPIYKKLIAPMRAKARELGYALAVHGTLKRDIDLVAIPWSYKVVTPKELAEALRLVVMEHHGIAYQKPLEAEDEWFQNGCQPYGKPHQRHCWSYHLGGGPYIDLSVIPPRDCLDPFGVHHKYDNHLPSSQDGGTP